MPVWTPNIGNGFGDFGLETELGDSPNLIVKSVDLPQRQHQAE